MARSSISNCILINGISENLTDSDLRSAIATQWHELRLSDVHRDRQYPSRAVAVFHDVIEASCDLKAQNLTGDWTASIINQPADSIIVEANLKAANDKLKMLFSSKRQGGKNVKSVQQINATIFEVVFEGGWDAVVSVCSRQWQAEGHVFTVYPNFACFKEPVKKTSPQVLEPKKVPPPVPPKPKYRPLSLQIQESLKADVNQFASKCDPNTDHCNNVDEQPTTETRDNIVVTRSLDTDESGRSKTIHNVPSIFSLLLRQLRFRQKVHEICVNIIIDVQHDEINLSGKRKNVKKFGAMLECEIKKLRELDDTVITFLNHQDVQDELKQMISSSILLELSDSDVILKVKLNPDNQTVTLQDFVRSIVESKECFTIPNKEFENNQEWKDIRHSFNAAYSYRKLLIQKEKVFVLSLAHKVQDLDLIFKLLNFTSIALKGS